MHISAPYHHPATLSCDILTIAKFPLQNVKIVKYKETDFAKLDCSKIIGALEKNAILNTVGSTTSHP